MKKITTFTILLLILTLFSAEFVVKPLKLLPNDISALKDKVKDVNDNYCALIKVKTDLNEISFSGMGYEKSINHNF